MCGEYLTTFAERRENVVGSEMFNDRRQIEHIARREAGTGVSSATVRPRTSWGWVG
jgi:hypothetical protein